MVLGWVQKSAREPGPRIGSGGEGRGNGRQEVHRGLQKKSLKEQREQV